MRIQSTAVPAAIKWSGSKRLVGPLLAALFPRVETFFDPFTGSGAILPFQSGLSAVAADIIPELVAFWQAVKRNPDELADGYEQRWQRLQDEGHTAYYDIRDVFNEYRNPFDFLFIYRT